MSDSTSNSFSAPAKKSKSLEKGLDEPVPLDLDVGVLSEDEDTLKLLSPIFHDSYESDENSSLSSLSSGESSPKSCELPQTLVEQGAWEQWFLHKAKEDRIKLEKKAEEERLIQETIKQEEKGREQKAAMKNQRIQEWFNTKRKQEKQEQELKQSKEREALTTQAEKQREIELRAQEKHKEWFERKTQEKAEKLKKLKKQKKEEEALKEEQEKEKCRRAEEKYKEWLNQAKSKDKPKSTCPYGNASPGFCNPIPWKPIHEPPEPEPEASLSPPENEPTDGKAPGKPKNKKNSIAARPPQTSMKPS